MQRPAVSDGVRRSLAVAGPVGVILLCWMLLMPPGSHPDEPGHLVRSAAVVRADGAGGIHVLPDRYRVPEPACYAFTPTQPATCADPPEHRGVDEEFTTRASDYPPGAHAMFGIAGLLPGLDPIWWGRLAAVITGTALVGGALAAALDRDQISAAAVLLGLTPMAWSIMAAVNPSAPAIAGAVALWVGLLRCAERRDGRYGWLLVAGWAALAVSRRDGLVWAVLIVAVVAASTRLTPTGICRLIGSRRLVVAGLAATVTVAWGVTSPSTTSRLVVVAPVALVLVELALRRADPAGEHWSKLSVTTRAIAAVVTTAVAAVGWILVVSTRTGGWDTNLTLAIAAQTDDNVVEAFGVLGWLDTPVPHLALFGWLLAIGALAGLATNARSWVPAVVVIGFAAITSWTFELLQGNTTGTYWQGRYSLPLLVGVPLLLVQHPGRVDSASVRRLTGPITVVALLFVNVAGWAAARRFGVGITGSHLPWRWDIPIQPVPPMILLVAMAAATATLARVVVGPRAAHR